MAAVSAAGVLTACGGSGNVASSAAASESASVSSDAVSSAASADETGTHIVIDHGGNEVEVPNKVTRVVIDQIPILSTYMAYFEGSAPISWATAVPSSRSFPILCSRTSPRS